MPDSEPLILTEGYFSDQSYNSQELMTQSINNWKQYCPYQLLPDGLSGRHRILQLHAMQIAYALRRGGTMHNAGSPKNCLAIAVVEKCVDKACFGRMKIQTGDILFFDDSSPHNFITNDSIQFIVVSICKKKLGAQLSKFSNILDQHIHDTDDLFATTLNNIWKRFTDPSDQKKDTQKFIETEDEILSIITKLLSEQTPVIPKLTAGEKTALEIRDRVFAHMDGKISIKSLAEEYGISEQTMQNSFKSLFGFTPKNFFRLLKLNLVHHELTQSKSSQTSVLKVARKWGFAHMGRFSKYYTELFGENPSITLKNVNPIVDGMHTHCVERKEEIH